MNAHSNFDNNSKLSLFTFGMKALLPVRSYLQTENSNNGDAFDKFHLITRATLSLLKRNLCSVCFSSNPILSVREKLLINGNPGECKYLPFYVDETNTFVCLVRVRPIWGGFYCQYTQLQHFLVEEQATPLRCADRSRYSSGPEWIGQGNASVNVRMRVDDSERVRKIDKYI